MDRAVLETIVLGGLISFTIEELQAFLPTRDSRMTEITTNTLEAAIELPCMLANQLQVYWRRLVLVGPSAGSR